jgi:hypothetical protein
MATGGVAQGGHDVSRFTDTALSEHRCNLSVVFRCPRCTRESRCSLSWTWRRATMRLRAGNASGPPSPTQNMQNDSPRSYTLPSPAA